jgi:hypothetical protein
MDRVRALIQHVVPRVPYAPREAPLPQCEPEPVVMGTRHDDS